MKGGGWNAENTQVSDGRRAPANKCRDCDNVVTVGRAFLCTDCALRTYSLRKKRQRAAARDRAKVLKAEADMQNTRNARDVIAEAIRSGLGNPRLPVAAADNAVAALTAAGFAIVRRRDPEDSTRHTTAMTDHRLHRHGVGVNHNNNRSLT